MATYTHHGLAGSPTLKWSSAMGGSYSATSTAIDITNSDGTHTTLLGNFTVVNGTVLGGTANSMVRTDPAGLLIYESVGGLQSMNVVQFLNAGASGRYGVAMSGHDTLDGHAGFNHLVGADGNDTFDGHGGSDKFEGGDGDDTYVGRAGDTIIEAEDEGFDTVETEELSYSPSPAKATGSTMNWSAARAATTTCTAEPATTRSAPMVPRTGCRATAATTPITASMRRTRWWKRRTAGSTPSGRISAAITWPPMWRTSRWRRPAPSAWPGTATSSATPSPVRPSSTRSMGTAVTTT
jgi:hypothetical protein